MKILLRLISLRRNIKVANARSIITYSVLHQNVNIDAQNDSESVKENILEASLPYVPNYGWSKESLVAGAKDVGYPSVTSGLFVNGGVDLVHYFHATSNEKLEDELKNLVSSDERISDKVVIKTAIETKLQMIIPYLNKWPQAMALTLLPQNLPESTRNFSKMINCIAFYAGYRELNTLWYARRMGIMTLYKTSELYLLQDKSIGNQNTWKYLDKSIKNLELVHDTIDQLGDLEKASQGAFTTVKNMLGLNNRI